MIGCVMDCVMSKWVLSLVAVFYLVFRWATSRNDYFKTKNVPFIPPEFFFGTARKLLMKSIAFHDHAMKLYNYHPKEKICGFFELRNPVLLLRDPEIIKQVTIKDFDHFQDHRSPIDETMDPLFGRVLVALHGSKWRDMRATLSPAFTSSKMRLMFQLVVDCAENAQKYLMQQAKTEKPLVWEMKDLYSRFANDVIASSAFGVEVNSLMNRNDQFHEMGKAVIGTGNNRSLVFMGYASFPKIMKFFKIPVFPKPTYNFFRSLVMDSMKYRDEKHIVRPDMINLLMQARKGALAFDKETTPEQGFSVVQESEIGLATHKREWEDDDFTAQCLLFFLAGFETISTLLSFATYELALNQDIQQKLIAEVDQFKQVIQGKSLTYELLSKMTYLDMVISEALRKWPPAVITDRKCTKPYILEYDNKELRIQPGDALWLPIFAIQRDPEYFEDPERFDPERFSEDNKKNIQPNTYFPFGVGPRSCIGSRFALMEGKAILFYLLSAFTFEVCDKTQVPLKMAACGLQVRTEKGIWIELKPRH